MSYKLETCLKLKSTSSFLVQLVCAICTYCMVLISPCVGYIGGSVLDRLLKHPNAENFRFTTLVRDSGKAEKLKSIGINAVIGSHSDLPVLENLSSKADVVFSLVGLLALLNSTFNSKLCRQTRMI